MIQLPAELKTEYFIEEGILLVDKPKCITSFDVIRFLQRAFGIKKIGHAGTLDPLASGLMILGIDKGTKLLEKYIKLHKAYVVQICLGKSTNTGDGEGDVTAAQKVSHISGEQIQEVLSGLTGIVSLSVPQHSAIKKNGIPLYEYARHGEDVEIPKKDMEIRDIVFQSLETSGDFLLLTCVMSVGSGAYIRSIAEEIGRRLGVPAMVSELRRISIADWPVEQAYPLTYDRVAEVLPRYKKD